jgi:hypothetical protein
LQTLRQASGNNQQQDYQMQSEGEGASVNAAQAVIHAAKMK